MNLSIAGALIALALQVGTKSPAAPTDLTISGDSKGIRLAWTAAPGDGNRYLVERGGPGYTLYEQIGGPISDTSFVADNRGYDRCKGQEHYTYRVRTVDAASSTSATSNVVSTRDIPGPLCNLPLVGNNVLDLLDALPGMHAIPFSSSNSTAFYLTGVKERTVSFASSDFSQSFSWGCADCSFLVGFDGLAPATSSGRGIVFKLSADGSEILATCRAVKCEATHFSKRYPLTAGESVTLPAQLRTFFTANTR